MVNHANGSEIFLPHMAAGALCWVFPVRSRGIEDGVDVYVDVVERTTIIERKLAGYSRHDSRGCLRVPTLLVRMCGFPWEVGMRIYDRYSRLV